MAVEWGNRGKETGSVANFMWTLLLLTSVVGTNIMALYSLSASRNLERNLANFQGFTTQLKESGKSSVPKEDLANTRLEVLEMRKDVQALMDQFRKSQAEIKGLISSSSSKTSEEVQNFHQSAAEEEEEETEAEAEENENGIYDSDVIEKLLDLLKEDDEGSKGSKEHVLPDELKQYVKARKLPLGRNPTTGLDEMVNPIGHSCLLNLDLLIQYMTYTVDALCPDDWNIAQALMVRGCEPLPRRRCFSPSASLHEPYPLMHSLWKLPADDSIRWSHYSCKNITCLNTRRELGVFEDCMDCFDLEGIEQTRWIYNKGEIDFSVDEILGLKNGSIRIGLDLGGGTGSFAARMKEKGVTIVTTTLNLNGPFNEYLGLRGLFPMHITVSPRLPFFDNTLDLVHSMHILNDWLPLQALEFLLYDIDRVIRPGGLFWLDRFFCRMDQLNKTYIPMFDLLGYNKLKWAVAPKVDRKDKEEVYLSALLEKPLRRE